MMRNILTVDEVTHDSTIACSYYYLSLLSYRVQRLFAKSRVNAQNMLLSKFHVAQQLPGSRKIAFKYDLNVFVVR
jgi:hypothetical protein